MTLSFHRSHVMPESGDHVFLTTKCRRCGVMVSDATILEPCTGAPAVPQASHETVTGVSFDPEACQLTVEKGPSTALTPEQQVRLELLKSLVTTQGAVQYQINWEWLIEAARVVITGKVPS